MKNLWSQDEATGKDELDLLVYQSRLIGADPSLVVWGGGNTSIKITEKDFRGRDTNVMIIKGSGSDLKAIERKHFSSLRLDDILPLFDRDFMSDEEMVDYLARCVLEPKAPRPSIETLLHAFLTFKSVAHSHADAIVALTNTHEAADILKEVYGNAGAVVEYIRPGFILSKRVGQAIRGDPSIKGVVLVNHGLFTWGDSTKEAYDKHIDLVTRAEEYAWDRARGKAVFNVVKHRVLDEERRHQIAAAMAPTLRCLVSQRQPMILRYDEGPDVLKFINSKEARDLSQIGPATPDHLLQTKRRPLWIQPQNPQNLARLLEQLRQGVEQYSREYSGWYREHTNGSDSMLDPYPRVILMPGVGMWTTGRDTRAALITGDIYHHTIGVMRAAQGIGHYTSLSAKDAYEAEYWPMELYKLTMAPPERELSRRVALVTGAAHGIGEAIARRLAAEGAHVMVTDIDSEGVQALTQELNSQHGPGRAAAVLMDVTSEEQVADAFKRLRLTYGGLDILVSNAGIATVGAIHELPLRQWQQALDINTTGHFLVASEAIRLMREQGMRGSLVFVGTKNATSPGKDFGAYSASKAAEVQLARVLAIENGEYGIHCNIVNPDAVFQGSGLWSQEVKEQRARAHGIAVQELEEFYRSRNLLKESITAEDVAEAVLFFAGPRSAKTTGAMLPVDGGLRDAFPR